MTTLNDLIDTNTVSISDLQPDVQDKPKVINDATATAVATHAALFSQDPSAVLDNYALTKTQLHEDGSSDVADSLIKSAQQTEMAKAKDTLPMLLADRTVSDEDKLNAIKNVYDENNKLYDPQNILAAQSLSQNIPQETVESEDTRYDFAQVINKNNDVREEQQKLYNRALVDVNPDLQDKVMDFFQLMIPGVNQYLTGKARAAVTGETAWSYVKSIFASGSAQDDIRQAILNAPIENRLPMTQKVIDAVLSTQGILGTKQNQLKQLQLLQSTIANQYIEDENKWADNLASIVDLATGIGAAAKAAKGIEAAKAARTAYEADVKAADTLAGGKPSAGPTGASRGPTGPSAGPSSGGRTFDVPNLIQSKVQPASVSQVIKDTNIDKYRAMHEAAMGDDTGQVAEALYGASKDDVAMHDLSPEIADPSGAVKAKVNVPDAMHINNITPDPSLDQFISHDGAIYYTSAQKQSNVAHIVQDFNNAFGVTSRKEMFQILSKPEAKLSGNTVSIKAVYGPQESGFRYPDEAISSVKFALRDYGVEDQHITLLKRVGGDYVPVDPKSVRGGVDPGFVNVQSDADIKAAYDSGHFAETTVKGNKIRLVGADHGGNVREVVAYDGDGKRIGSVLYGTDPERLDNPNVRVDPDWQRKGVANAMYDYAETHGAKFPAPADQKFMRSEAGQAFREARAASKRPRLQFSGNGGGDYLVQVDHNYKFNPFTMKDYAQLDVKNNWFMRSGAFIGDSGAGSLQRHLVTINSMLDPNITLGAMKAITKSAAVEHAFIKHGHDVATIFNSLKKNEKTVVWDMVKEANQKGIEWTETNMQAAGLSDRQKQFLRGWKDYWNQMWFYENRDHTQSLRNLGYMKFVDNPSDTILYARPLKLKHLSGNGIRVYNPGLDQVVNLSHENLQDLYINGGVIAELRNPLEVDGKTVGHVLSVEREGEGYLRAINPDDVTLNYRKGYYHVAYKDPIFIVKEIFNDLGNKVGEKAVATAANTKDAELMIKRLKSTDGGSYFHRPDSKTAGGRARDYMDVQQSIGRSPQRFRGKRLESSTSPIANPSHSNIMNPNEAMIASARSISRRISMRDPIDAMKQQAITNYGEKYFPKDETGRVQWPSDTAQVITSGKPDSKELAAARSVVEYVNYLEQGWINHIDDAYKAVLNTVAEILGEKSLKEGVVGKAAGLAETAVRKAPKSLTNIPRQAANTFFIVTNPIRQMLVQSHQIVQLAPLAPRFFGTKAPALTAYLVSRQLNIPTQPWMVKALNMSEKELEDMWNHFNQSGNSSAIDKHTMVTGALKDFTDGVSMPKTILGKAGQLAALPVRISRKVGFDAGENINQIVTWLVFRQRAIEAGKDMNDPAVRDEVAALSTNFTGNMTFAGSQPYEQNALSIAMQFMGWAHRWASNMTGNRLLSKADKAKLWGWALLLYGLPGGYAGYGLFEAMLPKDPETRDTIANGLIPLTYNKLASTVSGQPVDADWSSLSPFNLYGTADHMKQVMTGDLGQLIADSPAGTLFFGGNAKLTDFIKTTARWTHLIDDYGNPQEFSDVAKTFAEMFGGFSNTFKAMYAAKYGQKVSAYTGKVVDTNINTPQAILMAFGINPLDVQKSMYINNEMNKSYKELKQDIEYWHQEKRKLMLRDDITPNQLDYYLKMSSECWRVWDNNNPTARAICNKLIAQDMQDGDTRIFKQIMQMHGMMPKEKAQYLSNLYPDVEESKRQEYLNILDYLYSNDKE